MDQEDHMVKFKRIYTPLLFFSIFIIFQSSLHSNLINSAYANNGKANGHGQGHGHGYGHSQKANPHGQAKGKSHGKTNGIGKFKANNYPSVKNKPEKVGFAKQDKTAITNYFSDHPPLAGTLPPGIAMNLQRGKPLPPGIAKVFLPEDLVSKLPAHPGYDYLLVGKDAVLVDSATNVIADVLPNVLK